MSFVPAARLVAMSASAALMIATPLSAQVRRISVSTAGVQANGVSDQPAVDHSGRFVAFRSAASNLVAGDSNGQDDIFVRDRDVDADGVLDEPGAVATTRVSLATGGAQADAASEQPAIGSDGRFVVFVSAATNLVTAPDTVSGPIVAAQIYRHDRQTGETRLVSRGVTQAAADADCRAPSVSRDGRYVVFSSRATNLVAADPGFGGGIFLRDLETGAMLRLTEPLPESGPPVRPPGGSWYEAGTASIDPAGTRVAYSVELHLWYRTFSTNTGEIRLHDISSGTTRVLGVKGHGPQLLDTGRALGYHDATLGPAFSAAFHRGGWIDLETGAGSAVSHDSALNPKAIAWSPGGRYAAYLTRDPNPLPGVPEPRPAEPFLFDRDLSASWLLPAGTTLGPLDAAGRFTVFSAPATALVGDDTNGLADVFALDLSALFDADTDGLDDRWEQTVGLSAQAGTGDDGPGGDPDGDGVSNAAELARGTHPRGAVSRFLAEGATGSFFDTEIALANPGSTAAGAVIRFATDTGLQRWMYLRVPAGASRVIAAESLDGLEGTSFATTIESDLPIVADRRVAWGAERYGAHAETSVPSAQTAWYFAEGATGGPFDLFYLLQNPADVSVAVEVSYLRPAGSAPIVRAYTLPPHSRTTIHVDDVDPALAGADVSASIAAAQPIIAERAMYVTDGTLFRGGHASAGIPTLSPTWFFAEGATGNFFDLFLLLANPGPEPVSVTVDYLTDGGAARSKAYAVGARSRRTILVDDESFGADGMALANAAVSMRVTASSPIAAERAMWWPGEGGWHEGHATAGALGAAVRWAFADGGVRFSPTARTFVLIANPDAVDASVRVTILPEVAALAPIAETITVPAGSRFTFDVLSRLNVPGDSRQEVRFGALVESLGPAPAGIVVERATYWDVGSVTWEAGMGALAVPLP
jgi:hypothetical protein